MLEGAVGLKFLHFLAETSFRNMHFEETAEEPRERD
jgi:hypothetical protein